MNDPILKNKNKLESLSLPISARFVSDSLEYSEYKKEVASEKKGQAGSFTGRQGKLFLGNKILGDVKLEENNGNRSLIVLSPGIGIDKENISQTRFKLTVEITRPSFDLEDLLTGFGDSGYISVDKPLDGTVKIYLEDSQIAEGAPIIIGNRLGVRITETFFTSGIQDSTCTALDDDKTLLPAKLLFGSKKISLGEIIELEQGTLLELDQYLDSPFKLLFDNGQYFSVRLIIDDNSIKLRKAGSRNDLDLGEVDGCCRESKEDFTEFRGSIIDWLSGLALREVVKLIINQHPATIAIILSVLGPVRSGEIFQALPGDLQIQSLRVIFKGNLISASKINLFQEAFGKWKKIHFNTGDEPLRDISMGADCASEILANINTKLREEILDKLRVEDETLIQSSK